MTQGTDDVLETSIGLSLEEQKADEWAALAQQGHRLDWAGVEICQTDMIMNGFLGILKEKYNIELQKRFANELRRLGQTVGGCPPTLATRIQTLPVTTAVYVTRHDDIEAAVGYAEKHSQKELKEWMGRARIALQDPLMPLELRPWNVWNFGTRTPGQGESGYEWGAMCGQIIENLLWYYTEVGDVVIDPMAGTGVTYDACKRMQRKPRCYDKTPTRPDVIEKRDVYEGLPKEIAQLVFLDPPYFDIMEHELASYEDWKDFLKVCITHAKHALKPGGYLALILMNKCILRDNPHYGLVGDAYAILKESGLKFENMILTPLSNQMPGFKVSRAKEERTMLNLARIIWIFRRDA